MSGKHRPDLFLDAIKQATYTRDVGAGRGTDRSAIRCIKDAFADRYLRVEAKLGVGNVGGVLYVVTPRSADSTRGTYGEAVYVRACVVHLSILTVDASVVECRSGRGEFQLWAFAGQAPAACLRLSHASFPL